ncbi:30S ribosomal protein S8 [Halococcoides cellulosivorans]|uniref:Small ribosomal subunit protein uS8 n=1 Tax=Halococcoides cellulosivorans TaxID=1679096 RepID=A0A2R4X298_9EURY|nr:30S ribosomal protein S8 [Halococcoides cellulosivorans]AWB27917.1 30S ribosomal protein S8 [Halococcoides cellulosivorans]
MTSNDPLSDALSAIDNAESVGKLDQRVTPASDEIGSVLEVLYDRGYVAGFEYVEDGTSSAFEVELNGAVNECGSVTPRYSAGADEFERWEKRFLPARDYGTLVVTTSHGIMSHYEAREAGIGGQVIAYVY